MVNEFNNIFYSNKSTWIIDHVDTKGTHTKIKYMILMIEYSECNEIKALQGQFCPSSSTH